MLQRARIHRALDRDHNGIAKVAAAAPVPLQAMRLPIGARVGPTGGITSRMGMGSQLSAGCFGLGQTPTRASRPARTDLSADRRAALRLYVTPGDDCGDFGVGASTIYFNRLTG